MNITTPHVLVSGAGIAGLALALQLIRGGLRTTVVERAEAPRPATGTLRVQRWLPDSETMEKARALSKDAPA
ncbi:MAG TPA: FAD-dependent oxidoreductase, partial [Microbacterium sp.]|nr:FAD-dependent oxidoreductase [Microbacterium sp.]